MRLTAHEMELFNAACSDIGNDAAQELLNVFGVERSDDVLIQLPMMPLGLVTTLASHIWRAINHEHRKRTGCDLVFVDNAVA